MRKRFKIKKLIRNKFQRNIFLNDALASGSAMVSENIPLKHLVHSNGKEALCPPLEGGPKSLISRWGTQAKRAFIIRAILGGGWTSPLLHSWGSLKKYVTLLGVAKEIRCPTNVRIQRTNPHPNF